MSCFLFLMSAAGALNAAEIRGRIVDPSGSAVAEARVTASSAANGNSWHALTNSSGEFRLARLPEGGYLVTVEAAGFSAVRHLGAQAAAAGTPLEVVLDIERLSQRVVVTASGTPLSIDETAKALDVVDAAAMRQRSEFSIAEALRQIPGMRVQQLGGPGTFTRLQTRGLRAVDTSVLVDGFRLRDAGAPQGDATGFLGDLLIVDTARVEVLRGSGSSLYGTHALGGVVNIVSNQSGGPWHGELSAEGGGLGMLRGNARVSGGALDNRLGVSMGIAHLNVLEGADGDDRARNSSLQGTAQYTLSPATRASLRVWLTDAFTGLNSSPFAGPAPNYPARGFVRAIPLTPSQVSLAESGRPFDWTGANYSPALNDPDGRRTGRTTSILAGVTQQIGPGRSVRFSYQGLATSRDNRDGPGGVRFPPRFNNSAVFDGRIDVAQARIDSPWGRFQLFSAGYEFERERFENIARDENPNPAQRVFARTAVVQRSNSLFAQDQIRLLDSRLMISLSGRWQGFRVDRPAFAGGAPRYQREELPVPPNAWTGDVAVAYLLPGAGTKIRSHFGNAYRSPALYERFGTSFFSGSFSAFGDPRLRPERSLAFDAGVDQYLAGSRVRVSASYFYTVLRNVIAFGSVQLGLDPFGRFSGYLNTRGGLARGAEFSAEIKMWRGARIQGSYTHTRSQDRNSIFTDGLLISPRVARNMGTIWFTQRIGRRLEIGTDWSLIGDSVLPLFAGSGSRAFVFGGTKKGDINATYTVPFTDRRSLQLFTRIDNFLNRTWYEDGFRVPKAWAVGGIRFLF